MLLDGRTINEEVGFYDWQIVAHLKFNKSALFIA